MIYRLHYAPDNASLIIRLALEELGQPYETVLVDRASEAQRSAAYLALNPNGLIPTLETPQGPLFETAAILLWLADTHAALAPAQGSPERGPFLKWLFFASNTVHADLRILFYPDKYTAAAPAALQKGMRARLKTHLSLLEDLAAQQPVWFSPQSPSMLSIYVSTLLRWMTLYPTDGPRWLRLSELPHLHTIASQLERRPAMQAAIKAEGLGPTPLTAPQYCNPPEGSAI